MNILYIDPGTGSMLIQSIIAGALGLFFIFKSYWLKIKNMFCRDQKKKKESND
jgi:hypothetical protein